MVNAPAHSVCSGSRAKRSLASLMGRTQGFPSGSGWYKKSGCLQYPGVLQETQRTYTHWCQFPSQQSRKWRICLASAVQWVRSISVTFHRNRRPRKEEPPVRVHVTCYPSVSVCADTGRSVSRQGQERLPRCQGKEGPVYHPRS